MQVRREHIDRRVPIMDHQKCAKNCMHPDKGMSESRTVALK